MRTDYIPFPCSAGVTVGLVRHSELRPDAAPILRTEIAATHRTQRGLLDRYAIRRIGYSIRVGVTPLANLSVTLDAYADAKFGNSQAAGR